MIFEYFTVFSVASLLMTGIIYGFTTADEFKYVACSWKNSRCVHKQDTKDFFSSEVPASEWPKGPYALLTPREGCQESVEKGWRSGYISMTWKQPHTLISATSCDNSIKHSFEEKETEHMNTSGLDSCWHYLTPEMWPVIQSSLLGPFSKYAIRFNFCFKTEDTTDAGDERVWPNGSYSIFGDKQFCPLGFTASERVFKLPAIKSWTYHGFLPGFSINVTETDNSVTLTFKTCDHQTDNFVSNEINYQSYFSEDSFIFIKDVHNLSCPRLQDTHVAVEVIKLLEDVNDNRKIIDLFTICYYRPSIWSIDLNTDLYDTGYPLPSYSKQAFVILNPTLTYGRKTTAIVPFKELGTQAWSIGQDGITIPWLLVDLGRNLIVIGLHLANAHMSEQEDTEDRPFSKFFVSDNRWIADAFGAISCPFTEHRWEKRLYFSCLKELEGRYVKLVGYSGEETSRFHSLVQTVEVLTSAKMLYNESACNADLGMSDGSVNDFQITASSWIPQFLPTSVRPFFSGWCSETSDKNPFITIDMLNDTKIEGITIYNWERLEEFVTDGVYMKRHVPVGCKTIMVSYFTDFNIGQSWTYINKSFSLDMFLPVEHPQTFLHNPVFARYITVYIIDSMTENANCLRFELQGCRRNDKSGLNLPELLAVNWMWSLTNVYGTEMITFNNLQTITNMSVLSSIGYPLYYSGGMSYTWIIDFEEGSFIRLIFSNTSFNKYGTEVLGQCSDTLKVLPAAYQEETMYIDQQFNGFVLLIESDISYMSMTLSTCRATSRTSSSERYGFKAFVSKKDIPACSFQPGTENNALGRSCTRPIMFITSASRLNLLDTRVAEDWYIQAKHPLIHLKILYFNVRCDTGSAFHIIYLFSGEKRFCNMRRVQSDIYSDSHMLRIRFEKEQNEMTAASHRKSAREGFKAVYKTFEKRMPYLIDDPKVSKEVMWMLGNIEMNDMTMWMTEYNGIAVYKDCSKKFGKCYFVHYGPVMTWVSAGAACWNRQSRLVSIHSDEEHELIKYILRKMYYGMVPNTIQQDLQRPGMSSIKINLNYFTYIGLSRLTSETGRIAHVWEDGSPLTFSAWKLNEPSSDGDCTRMGFQVFDTNNTWEAGSCKYEVASFFICEQHITTQEQHDTSPVLDTASDQCYLTHSMYSGQWNRTRSGKMCQPWESQYPHGHEFFLDSQFPDGSVTEAFNYCRDPYNEGFLWCFTVDPVTETEPCVFLYKYQLGDEADDFAFRNGTFECSNGDLIQLQNLCNGFPNCRDLTDETNCTDTVHALMKNRTNTTEVEEVNDSYLKLNETYSLFECESKEWISLLARCDGVIDCFDASDEVNCSLSNGVHICSKDEYLCDDGGCIHISQMCDFIADCTDGSDENCDYPSCSREEYRCLNHQCIPIQNRCDAYEHCLDGTDETSCDGCSQNAFHCDVLRCIPKRVVCDKYFDCKDESDERSCDQPIRNSCEEWWIAGYRKSGIYKLNDTEAECNFDTVSNGGHIYTTFHNFEITARDGIELIHFMDDELSDPSNSTVDRLFQNNSYICLQNITQSCVPAHMAAAEYEDPNYETVYKQCECLVTQVYPGRYDTNSSIWYGCESGEPVTDMDRLLFEYQEVLAYRAMKLKENFPRDVEITFGPAVCKYVNVFDETNIGCQDGYVFPASVRCVYDTDAAGFIWGCRSRQHLQGCETFKCPKNTVKCPGSFCLPLKFICDGEKQCPGGQDEHDCGCLDEDREIVLLFKDRKGHQENKNLRRIATQLYTTNSIVRELRYHQRTVSDKLDFGHRLLDISDRKILAYMNINKQFICNYSILASSFVNSIEFSKNKSGVIFFQERNDPDTLAEMMFGNLKSKPKFLIYRVLLDTYHAKTFPYVRDVVVKRLTTLATVGSMYFPDLCREASKMYCPNEYRCAASKTCIPPGQVCDGHTQCVLGDDEKMCGYSCPTKCSCVEYTTDCSYANIDSNTVASLHRKSRVVDLSGNPGLKKTLENAKWNLPFLILLNLSKCDIEVITENKFQTLQNLRILDLSFNRFFKIPRYAFTGLRNLKVLNLFGNTEIYSIEPFSFSGLLSISSLEIKGATIRKMSANAFSGLDLNHMYLSDNKIMEMEDDIFSGLNVTVMDIRNNDITGFNKGLFRGVSGLVSLHCPAFKYCCVRPNYLAEGNCFPEKDEFSSCDDLLRLSALQTMLWLIGILALLGNILSVVYSLVFHRERLKMGYGIFVTNLAVADFLMGIYLIIIAIADAVFRKRYIFIDDFWRNSAWCTVAGFLSTVSSEASVFFLCLITLDRIFVIKYPFGQVRFDKKKSIIACIVSWIVALSIGLIPILYSGYFHGGFFSKSGICIALPLTRKKHPGWLYSVIIFIGLNFVTFCMIAIGQIMIYLEIKKATSGVRNSSSGWGKSGAGRRRELTIARNLLFVVATDFLCWIPIGCMGMMSLSGHVIPSDVYAWTAVFILPVNAALNPVLYTLTAILGNKKPEPQVEQGVRTESTSQGLKQVQLINGYSRYFSTRSDSLGHTFVSLNDLLKHDAKISSKVIAKICLHLIRSVRLLHKNSLIIARLDGSVVYISMQYGKIIGDIQLRQQPRLCRSTEKKAEDIFQLGQVLRSLLAKRNKQALE